jgi:dCTP deaminase
MILSDRDIRKAVEEGRIVIEPAPDFESQLGSCSIDFHLGNKFLIFDFANCPYIDLKKGFNAEEVMEEVIVAEGKSFIIHPRDFVLASTVENLELPDNLLGRIEGRSSLGRLGIIVHGTASVFDPGWRGRPTMELGNLGVMPVAIYPGMRICSFTFEELTQPAETPYWRKHDNKYAGQAGPMASRIGREINN